MKKLFLMMFCAAFVCLAAMICRADEIKEAPLKGPANPAVVVRVRNMKKVDFSGLVTQIDVTARTITLRSGGKSISFDMADPFLLGYGSIDEIKRGDSISVGYAKGGLVIRKGSFPVTQRRTAYTASAPTTSTPAHKTKKKGPLRLTRKADTNCFADIDNDKNGRISPVELSVAQPELTIEKFKEYDINGDGTLNEAEFRAMKKRH